MALPAAYKLLFYRSDAAGDPAGPEDLFLRQIGGLLAGDDPADRLNCLAHHLDAEQFPEKFLGEIFKAFVSCGVLPDQLAGPAFSPDADFLLRSALDLCRRLRDLPAGLPPEEAARLLPRARHIFDGLPDFRGDTGALAQALRAADPFRTERVFTYHHGEFYPVKPSSVKDVSKFFGFPGVRAAFAASLPVGLRFSQRLEQRVRFVVIAAMPVKRCKRGVAFLAGSRLVVRFE